MERISMEQGPNLELFNAIMEEAMDRFSGDMLTPELIVNIEFFLNQRIKAEIDRGNFRNRFITPSSRIAEFSYVEVRQDPNNPSSILAIPRWMYENE